MLGLVASIFWGSQFSVAHSLFESIDPWTLTFVRYGLVAIAFLALLRIVEGRSAFRLEGHGRRAAFLGGFGITGGVLVVWVGLEHTDPLTAALLIASQPLLIAVWVRLRGGPPVGRATAAAIVAAFAGVLLVLTRGNPAALVEGDVGWGILLVLFGGLGWVVYTAEGGSFPGWSPLRFTAITAVPGMLVIGALTAGAAAIGWAEPSAGSLTGAPLLLAYVIVGPTLIAIFAWNAGRVRLGPQNIALFMNLVPVTTFAIETARGYRPGVAELLGALLTISALVGSNLAQRRRAAAAAASRPPRGAPAPAPAR